MAKQIIWSLQAQNDRKEILTYWFVRKKSNTYGKKLNLLIRKAIKLISLYPYIGFKTDVENVRAKVLRDYLIIYQVSEKRIEILSIWHSKRNPGDLIKQLH